MCPSVPLGDDEQPRAWGDGPLINNCPLQNVFYWDDYGNLLRHRRRALRSSAWLGVSAVAVVTWIVPSPLGGDERRAPSPWEIRVQREASDPLPQHHEMAVPLPGREGARHSPQIREYGWATSMGGRCAAFSGPAAPASGRAPGPIEEERAALAGVGEFTEPSALNK